MPALRKPHRIAVLLPQVESQDAFAAEAALLFWMTCIETLRRHPGLAVYDAESTPLFPRNGHFAPQYAELGATPTDAFFASTRRDEVVWLELALPKGVSKLHVLPRTGARKSYDAIGRTVGDQLNHVFNSWLAASGLPPLAKKLEPVTAEEVTATIRVIAPSLVEQVRNWTIATPAAAPVAAAPAAGADDIDAALDALVQTGERALPSIAQVKRSSPARMLANRLPQALRVPALRTIELAFGEDLGDLILAADPEHPQGLFAKLMVAPAKDHAMLRRVIAASPGWARPYGELAGDGDGAPTALEKLAGAGIAALCRPAQLDVIEAAAMRLRDDGRPDEAVRLMERALQLHDADPRAHAALLALYRATDRVGAWLAAAERAGRLHGTAPDPTLPRYPDQLQIDRLRDEARLHAGQVDPGASQPAWSAARAAWLCGDPARYLELSAQAPPDSGLDLAMLLDALVATGREDEVPLAWAHYGLGKKLATPVARLAAARCSLIAGDWRRGLEELWRVELGESGRDDHVAIAHCGLLLSIMPLEIAEAALAERLGAGANGLARRLARDIADFIPGAAKSAVVMKALGRPVNQEVDPSTLAAFSIGPRARAAIDALFSEIEPEIEPSERRAAVLDRRAARRGTKVERAVTVVIDPLLAADRLVNRWFEVVHVEGARDEIARAAIYVAAYALGRYFAATTAVPSVNAGAFRTVAAEALALVRVHRAQISDGDVRALLGVIDPLLRRVDRWVGSSWLAAVERSCGIDERAAGDVAGFAAGTATVAARILGPEESAVLAASVARLHRDRPDGWESATSAQASRLALHTGRAGASEWADATAAELAAKAIELDDAIDALHTASYLAEGSSVEPATHLARILFEAGRAPAAFAAIAAGMPGATPKTRERAIATLAAPWQDAITDIPIAPDRAAAQMFEALQRRDPVRAEKLGRWLVACDPANADANRNLGLALAQQGKIADALHYLVRGTGDQATQILAGVLYQANRPAEALAVLDHASRWYTRADQWLGFGAVADAAADPARAERAYARATELDANALDATQLDAYARALHALSRYDDAARIAQRAIERNTNPAAASSFALTLEQAQERTAPTFNESPRPIKKRAPAFVALDAGDFAGAAARLDERDWKTRRAAITATRHRTPSEHVVAVTARAERAAASILVATIGSLEPDAVVCRMIALAIREQSAFARDPVPRGSRAPAAASTPPRFADRVVVQGGKIARVADYVALLRDLAALSPREALEQFDLDDAGYLEVGKAWGAALDADPALAAEVAAGLARR